MNSNKRIKGILSLISGALTHLLIGNLFSFPNFIPYYKSYLYYQNGNKDVISEIQLYFIAPTGIFVHNTLPSVTGFLDKILGIRILTIIGMLSLFTSQLIMYNFIKYYLLIFSYILFGFCGSLTYFQALKNCWKYFPEKKGVISGIIFSCFGLSSFAFTTIGDLIINRKSVKKDENGYYPKDIADKFLSYLKFYIICIIVMGSISSILAFPYEEEQEQNKPIVAEFENEEANLTKESNDNQNEEKLESNNKKEENKENKLTLQEILKSLEFYKCLAVAGCTLIFGFLLSNTYRNFGINQNLDDSGMQILSKAFTLLNTFSRLGWGVIYDKFGFKIPYLIICINQIICGSLVYSASKNIITYIIVVCFGVLSYAGHIILFPNLIHHKFGVDNSVIILGICGIFGGVACILGPILTLFFLENNNDYLKIYLIGTAPTIVSLILTLFIKIEKKEDELVKNENVENNDDLKIMSDRYTNDATEN